MPLVVNHNSASMRAQTNVSRTQRGLAQSFNRISSGLRITQAADDAARDRGFDASAALRWHGARISELRSRFSSAY